MLYLSHLGIQAWCIHVFNMWRFFNLRCFIYKQRGIKTVPNMNYVFWYLDMTVLIQSYSFILLNIDCQLKHFIKVLKLKLYLYFIQKIINYRKLQSNLATNLFYLIIIIISLFQAFIRVSILLLVTMARNCMLVVHNSLIS